MNGEASATIIIVAAPELLPGVETNAERQGKLVTYSTEQWPTYPLAVGANSDTPIVFFNARVLGRIEPLSGRRQL